MHCKGVYYFMKHFKIPDFCMSEYVYVFICVLCISMLNILLIMGHRPEFFGRHWDPHCY